MTNIRKNSLHEIVEEELRKKVWLALEDWVKSGESFAFVENEVEDMLEILHDYGV